MHDIEASVFFMLDLGNQIGGGDIDEVAGGEGKEKRHIEGERRAVRDETAGQESQRRKKVVEQCFAFFPTAMDEDAEVSQFLRHLMGSGGEPGADTNSDVDEKRPGRGVLFCC